MVTVRYAKAFRNNVRKMRDGQQLRRLLQKIIERPTVGKPMRHTRKRTREVYLGPYRIAYSYENDKIAFLDIYHKDEQ